MEIQAIKIVICSWESYGWCALNSARFYHSNGSTDLKKASISVKYSLKKMHTWSITEVNNKVFTSSLQTSLILKVYIGARDSAHWRTSHHVHESMPTMKEVQYNHRKSHLSSNAQTEKSWFTRLNQEITARKVGESSVLELCNVQKITWLNCSHNNPVQFMTTSVYVHYKPVFFHRSTQLGWDHVH